MAVVPDYGEEAAAGGSDDHGAEPAVEEARHVPECRLDDAGWSNVSI